MYSSDFHLTTSAQWWLTGGQVWTLSELLHAVLCTTVTVTVAVYFEPVCVFFFHSARHSLFSLDFIACFLLVILCLVAIPTEMSASSHLLNGLLWIWIIVARSRRLSQLAMFYHTLSQVVSPSVIKTLNIGTTDLEVPGRHSLCTDIVVVLCRWLILCSVWYFDAWDSVDVLYNADELRQYLVFVSTGYTLYLETVNMSRWNFLAGYPVARQQGGQQISRISVERG